MSKNAIKKYIVSELKKLDINLISNKTFINSLMKISVQQFERKCENQRHIVRTRSVSTNHK